MHLDELGAQEEFDQLPVRTDPELLADVTSWGGVQRSCDLNVVVGVYLGIGPERHVERLGGRRKQGRLLDRLEHVAWDLASRAVDTAPGDLGAPLGRASAGIVQVPKLLAREPALPNEGDLVFHPWLVLGFTDPCWVDEDAALLSVIEKSGNYRRLEHNGLEQ